MVNSYEEAEAYILGIPKFASKNSMENTGRFLTCLGNPSSGRKVIHVAGTNGKGSVCAYLASVMKEAGIRTGMFTSPHLVTMRERFVVDGRMVSQEDFLWAFQKVADALLALPEDLRRVSYHPTFFEYLFFMAMLLFDKEQVEYLILETGLGGRLDATNVLENKKICVITSIGYDHMEYLGNTLCEIAREKAGILRKNVPVVYLKEPTEAAMAIEESAHTVGAECICLETDAIKDINIQNKTIDFSFQINYYDYIGFRVSTTAYYQVENASLALKTLERLADERITVTDMQEGIRKMVWEGRMEEILPNVFLDGAHNADGIRAFLETVRLHDCGGKRILLYSVVKDKQYETVAECLATSGLFDIVGIVELADARALPIAILEETFKQYTELEYRKYDGLGAALRELVFNKDDEDKVYIAGSLYLVGEVKAFLRRPRHD